MFASMLGAGDGLFLLHADRGEKGLKVCEEVIICDAEVPVEEEEELLFH